jgi:2-C-methyl-D-erythritol 2,4-cyclodiphosphate synthase
VSAGFSGGGLDGGAIGSGRVGIGYDLHRLVEGRPFHLGAIEIPNDKGLMGHSDGDVLCHAIADALLGAAALGEIGSLYPDTDPRWKGVAGSALLQDVAGRLGGAGIDIVNVDAVVIAERPRLAPHREAMRTAVAGALACDRERVSIKIKSNEGCDSIGRGEAIAAQAVALVRAR